MFIYSFTLRTGLYFGYKLERDFFALYSLFSFYLLLFLWFSSINIHLFLMLVLRFDLVKCRLQLLSCIFYHLFLLLLLLLLSLLIFFLIIVFAIYVFYSLLKCIGILIPCLNNVLLEDKYLSVGNYI